MRPFPRASSAAFAKDCSGLNKNPFRPWRLYPDSVGAWREPFSKPNPATAGPATPKIIFSNQKRSPSRSWRLYPDSVGALRESSAFSLTEVVIAMGVAAVAFTSIIGLFPLGLGMSKETFETTQAALIAQSLMNQILDVQGGTGNTGFRRINVTTNNDPTQSGNLASFNVNSYNPSTTLYVFYTNYLNPSNGQTSWKPAGTATSAEWLTGKPNSPAIVRVTLNRIFTGGASYDIHGVEVQVDYPGSAKYTNRTHEIFSRICH